MNLGRTGPNLPATTDASNCIVQVNATHLFMTGTETADRGFLFSIDRTDDHFAATPRNDDDPNESKVQAGVAASIYHPR